MIIHIHCNFGDFQSLNDIIMFYKEIRGAIYSRWLHDFHVTSWSVLTVLKLSKPGQIVRCILVQFTHTNLPNAAVKQFSNHVLLLINNASCHMFSIKHQKQLHRNENSLHVSCQSNQVTDFSSDKPKLLKQ